MDYDFNSIATYRDWQGWAHSPFPGSVLEDLYELGYIQSQCPELIGMVGCEQDSKHHPEGSVWVHTQIALNWAAYVAKRDGLVGEAVEVLLFAVLLHDCGKPMTTVKHKDGRITSYEHDLIGSALSYSFMNRIGAPQHIEQQVSALVRHHMAWSSHGKGAISHKFVRRLIERLRPATIEQWERVVECDISARPPHPPARPVACVLEIARNLLPLENPKSDRLVTGDDLLALGIEQGPLLGQILRKLYEAQQANEFVTKEDGLDWLRENVSYMSLISQ